MRKHNTMAYRPEPQPPWPDYDIGDTEVLAATGQSREEPLGLCEEFPRGAGPAVHVELRELLTKGGHHPITGLSCFIDRLSFTALATTTG